MHFLEGKLQVWVVGALVFVLLTGVLPGSDGIADAWGRMPRDAQLFLAECLAHDAQARPTASAALAGAAWLGIFSAGSAPRPSPLADPPKPSAPEVQARPRRCTVQ